MGLTPTSDKRLQTWVLNEINKNANHHNIHLLTMANNLHNMSKRTALTGQLVRRILTDDKCNISSGVPLTNRHEFDKYIANMLYHKLRHTFNNENSNEETSQLILTFKT